MTTTNQAASEVIESIAKTSLGWLAGSGHLVIRRSRGRVAFATGVRRGSWWRGVIPGVVVSSLELGMIGAIQLVLFQLSSNFKIVFHLSLSSEFVAELLSETSDLGNGGEVPMVGYLPVRRIRRISFTPILTDLMSSRQRDAASESITVRKRTNLISRALTIETKKLISKL
jgi:hypothetical protein